MIEPFAWAIVCDDYRIEGTGKPFIIGIYVQDMVFATLPAVVPHVIVAVTVVSDISEPITRYTVEITWPGGSVTQDFDLGPYVPSPEIPGVKMPPIQKVECRSIVPVMPFSVTEPGAMLVMVKHSKGELRAKMLRLYAQPQQIPPPPASA